MFVQSEEFVKAHGGRVDDISIYGQESNPNMATGGDEPSDSWVRCRLDKEPADTFARDQFPDVKFDYIMANPPSTSQIGVARNTRVTLVGSSVDPQ